MEPGLVRLVDGLLDQAAARGKIDDFASAIQVEVIGNLLDVPHDERAPLRERDWSLAILGELEPALNAEQEARGNRAVADFIDYLVTLVARRRAHPGDPPQYDVLTRLIQSEADGERLDAGTIKTTLGRDLGKINATNLREAHRLLEEGRAIGKLVLTGF